MGRLEKPAELLRFPLLFCEAKTYFISLKGLKILQIKKLLHTILTFYGPIGAPAVSKNK